VALNPEKPEATPLGFCAVHGRIRDLDQGFVVLGIAGIDGDADARPDFDCLRVVPQAERRCKRRNDFFGNGRGILPARYVAQDHGKFVTPYAGYRVGLAHLLADSFGNTFQELVAGVVPERQLFLAMALDGTMPDSV
jgi:hypothetical protein